MRRTIPESVVITCDYCQATNVHKCDAYRVVVECPKLDMDESGFMAIWKTCRGPSDAAYDLCRSCYAKALR